MVFRRSGMGLETFEVGVAATEVQAWSRSLVEAVQGGEVGWRPPYARSVDGGAAGDGRRLGEALFSEALAGVDGERLVIVPDRSSASVPFTLLEVAGVPLLDRWTLTVSPGLGGVDRSGGAGESPPNLGSLLVIGEPAARSAVVPRLGPLPAAEDEARVVAALYDGPRILLGAGADRDRFLELAPRHRVVHYSGHSSLDPFVPHRSQLHLAPVTGSDSGDVEAVEIAALDLSAVELVVLSSCSSTIDRSRRRRAPFGLGGAFLEAGAHAVVGALWPVDDHATAALMERFHRRLVEGADPADALRRAQLEMSESENPRFADPAVWGAFRVLAPYFREMTRKLPAH